MARAAYAAAALAVGLVAACGPSETSVHPLERTSSPGPATAPQPRSSEGTGTSEALLTLSDRRITESSGLARSPLHKGVLYTHNDKGSGPELFAVDSSGLRAVITLRGAAAVDWEDVASTPDGRLWVADIGDAEGLRPEISVYTVDEPADLRTSTVAATRYRFRYPDGARNAEALLVHPETFRVYIVSKEPNGGTVYAAPRKLRRNQPQTLRPVREAPPTVTGADFAPDGQAAVLRNYGKAFFYPALDAEPVTTRLPQQMQGESVTFDKDGSHVLVGSEGRRSDVLRLPVPDEVRQ